MPSRWVDNSVYFGPDRRRKPSKRWNDRRRLDEAGEPPPLAGLLRRLRIRIAGRSADDRKHALEMLKAAISETTRLNWPQCHAVLLDIDEIIRTGSKSLSAADDLIVQALEHAAFGR